LITLTSVTLVTACSTAPDQQAAQAPVTTVTTVAGTAPSTAPTADDWITYHHDNTRTGVAAHLARAGTLRQAWHTDLDGAVYGQPLLVGGTLLAGTEGDTVYALDADTGKVLWSTHVGTPQPLSGLPCGDIDPLGITGTMAYDPATHRVFAVAETVGGAHTLVGIDVHTGKVEVHTPVEPPKGDRLAHQQRAALTVLNGRVYVAYGGLAGDCAQYIGSVVSVTTAGTHRLSYAIPTTREAGIWAPGGAVVAGSSLLYSDGNGESTSGGYDGSDSVIALAPSTLARTDLFAPTTWPQDNADDLDLGSSNPVSIGPWVFVAGKRGTGYVMRAGHLGGVGGQVAQAEICKSFGGASVDGTTAYVPCTDGPRAVTIDDDGTPQVRWHAPVTANGAPTVGGGAVFVTDYRNGTLYALNEATGQVISKIDTGELPHFASPTLAGSTAYVGTLKGVTAFAGA
jgi:YVTN family beta-propeller protein